MFSTAGLRAEPKDIILTIFLCKDAEQCWTDYQLFYLNYFIVKIEHFFTSAKTQLFVTRYSLNLTKPVAESGALPGKHLDSNIECDKEKKGENPKLKYI